ncbi:MAG: MATE family efflux transporter [Clostridia bacterium]|nr:MATE family efflux transporter [Clostridia bacterium]
MEKTIKSNVMPRGAFTRLAITTAMPIMIQNIIFTLVSSADTIMLGYVSQDAMSASSLANQLANIMFCAFYGLTAGASVLASQYWGKGDRQTIEKVLGLAVRISLFISVFFFVIAFFFPYATMKVFTNEPGIIAEGVKYLRINSVSYILIGFSQIYLCVLRSTDRLVLPTVTYIVSLVVNVSLNATFIFGLFGAPKLGLAGVALGTVAARVVEFAICLVDSLHNRVYKFRIKYVFAKSGLLMKDFMNLAVPSLVNDIVWSLACSAYSVIMGHMGSDAVAANAVAVMAVNIAAIACRGFANATTILVSRPLGENNKEASKVYSQRMLIITTIVSVAGGAILILIRPWIVGFYAEGSKLTEGALTLLNTMLLMQIIRLIGEGINTCLICGCFRGGGDSKFGMKLDAIFMWLVAVPLMAGAAFVLKLPAIWVYLVMCLDEWYKMPPTFVHYFKYEWMKNITREKDEIA